MMEAGQSLFAARGWVGLLSAYAAIQGPMLWSLVRHRAPWGHFLVSPAAAAALTVATGFGIAVAGVGWRTLGWGTAMPEWLAVAVSLGVGFAGGARLAGTAKPAVQVQRGTRITADAPSFREPVHNSTRDRIRSSSRRLARPLTLGGLPLTSADETKHFKFIGTTGTGKSSAIVELLEGALARGDRAVIADPDGGYLRRFYDPARGDVVLNPFDAGSRPWDPFLEIRHPFDVDQLVRSMIPDHEGPERSWRQYARTFVSAVMRQAWEAGVRDPAELYRLIAIAEPDELRRLVRGTPAQPFLHEQNGRMFDSLRSVASSATAALEYVVTQHANQHASQDGPAFSVRDWIAGRSGEAAGRGVLFIPYQANQIDSLRNLASAWLRLAIFESMSRGEQDHRLWFVVDELDALGKIDGLKDALARLRKFGGRCVLGFQSIAQVSTTYGSGEAQTVVENCGNSLILRCSASEHGGTALFASRLVGQRQVVRTTASRSRAPLQVLPSVSVGEHVMIEPAILESEIEQLPDLEGWLKRASDPTWRAVRLAPPAALRARREAVTKWQQTKDEPSTTLQAGAERS